MRNCSELLCEAKLARADKPKMITNIHAPFKATVGENHPTW